MAVEVHPTEQALVARAIEIVSAAAARGPVALSGGATPIPVYAGLAAARVSGSWYQVDERCVPYGHPDSNATAIERAGLSLHRIRTEMRPGVAAQSYERELRTAWAGAPPALVVLGIGLDGHTASLFPGSPELDERERWVVVTRRAHSGHRRVTLTFPVLAAAGERLFVVAGAEKRHIVRRALEGDDLPAARVGEARWLLDAAAAGDVV